MTPFCVIGTPRSRTTWFSRFLSHGDIHCAHEPSKLWASNAAIRNYFSRPNFGAADSLLTVKWRHLLAAGVKLVAVVRPFDEVVASARAAGLPVPPAAIELLGRMYTAIGELPNDVPKYRMDALEPAVCSSIFEYCAEYACPPGWVEHWCPQIVEPDIPDLLRYAEQHSAAIATFLKDS